MKTILPWKKIGIGVLFIMALFVILGQLLLRMNDG